MRARFLLLLPLLLAGCAEPPAVPPPHPAHPLARPVVARASARAPAPAACEREPRPAGNDAELHRLREQNEKLAQDLAESRHRADQLAATVQALRDVERELPNRSR